MQEAIAHYGAITLRTAELKKFFAQKGASYVPPAILNLIKTSWGEVNLALWAETRPVSDPTRVQASVNVPTLSDDDMVAKYAEKIAGLRNAIRQCVEGRNGKDGLRAIICGGASGMGKTWNTREILEEMAAVSSKVVSIQYVTAGNITPVAFYARLYQNQTKGQILVFDDSDALFDDAKILNLLKAACDMGVPKRILAWDTSKEIEYNGETIPNQFEFNGSVIVLSNLNFYLEIEKESKRAQHLAAFTSRASYIDLHLDRAYYRPIITGMIDRGLILTEYSDTVRHVTVQFLLKHWNEFKQNPSIRLVCELARLADMSITEETDIHGEVKIDGIGEFMTIATALKL